MPYGTGFFLTPQDRDELIEQNPRNAERIFPFVGGRELNTSTSTVPERYIIDFGELSLEQSSQWPDLLAIVEHAVKPERDRLPQKNSVNVDRRRRWWQFAGRSPEMYRAIAPLKRCLLCAQTTKHLALAFLPTARVFDQKLCVFPFDSYSPFAVLQSQVHVVWAWLLSATMKTDLSYAPSACFDTFPFPRPDPREKIPELEQAGSDFYKTRARYMVATDQGLTKTYNALKDPANTDPAILELRRLTEAMDRAVLGAYGWTDLYLKNDLPPYCPRTPAEQSALQAFQDEIIDRLYQLNAERATAEAASQPTKTKKAKKPKPPTPQGDLF
jgi:hypothetical protein